MCLYSEPITLDDDEQPVEQPDDLAFQQPADLPDDQPVAGPSNAQYVHKV